VPAGKPTIMRTGRLGYADVWACTPRLTALAARPRAKAAWRRFKEVTVFKRVFMVRVSDK